MSTYMVDGKKMMNICILEVLRKYTDSEHTMDQKDIIKKLETEYGMKVDRKSVKSNLMILVIIWNVRRLNVKIKMERPRS